MSELISRPRCAADLARLEQFYSAYAWCINPILTLRDLLRRLEEELDRYAACHERWQAEEHRINFYLFSCAIACVIDDYLSARPWELASLARRIPHFRRGIRAAEGLLNLPHKIRSRSANALLLVWRERWTACVDSACDLLLDERDERFLELARSAMVLAPKAINESALTRRMRIPEGFRCQDLTHQDVCAMTDGYLAIRSHSGAPIAVIGPRTAGAYFAPLAAAHLRRSGHSQVQWLTIRPKSGLATRERRLLSPLIGAHASLLIIDDHPNTGHTLELLLGLLIRAGADSRDITITVPGHPARPNWTLPHQTERGVSIFALPPEEQHKARLLASGWGEQVLQEYFEGSDWEAVTILEDADTASLNRHFAARASDGFQVRLKRVFAVQLQEGAATQYQRILAKSVGWGWLGYHAWIAGSALSGFVPVPITQQSGFLFSKWIEGEPLAASGDREDRLPEAFAGYLGARVRKLAFEEDPCYQPCGYSWCGWDDLITLLGRVYGPYVGRLKSSLIRRRLASYLAPWPGLLDGRMKPDDWISSGAALYKTDFEQHNFGGGELDVVDPAWDLASAIFEFRLTSEAERQLLRLYSEESGDFEIQQRLLLYKLLYSAASIRAARYWSSREITDEQRKHWHRIYIAACDFATFNLARHCAGALPPKPVQWTNRLFFLDLDGVFDWDFLGFPHTSPNGIRALEVLRAGGFSVVPNTARSLRHALEYCQTYNLPGAIAELGSVFWDAVNGREISLVSPTGLAELQRLRETLQALGGVLIDPGNKYSLRAYRFEHGRTKALGRSEVEQAFREAGCNGLFFIQSFSVTYILEKGRNKGAALKAVKSGLGHPIESVAAMGDSDPDIDMLIAADKAYAPANASRGLRKLIAAGKCRKTRSWLQTGLLEAAQELSQNTSHHERSLHSDPAHLLDVLLAVPDRSPFRRKLDILRWRQL